MKRMSSIVSHALPPTLMSAKPPPTSIVNQSKANMMIRSSTPETPAIFSPVLSLLASIYSPRSG